MSDIQINRRRFCSAAAATVAVGAVAASSSTTASEPASFKFNYILASAMYGGLSLAEILPEVRKTGATAIDIWPKVHGNQREQVDELGEQHFAAMLHEHNVTLGCLTQYRLGPFGLQDEMRMANRFGCRTIVTGAAGPRGLKGSELKSAITDFVEKVKPHLAIAEQTDVTIAIENHRGNLIENADGIKWLTELRPSKRLGIALAPSHLPQDADQIAGIVRDIGDALTVFFAWQRGNDFINVKLPRAEELLQMPGRGTLDFGPIVDALKSIRYNGWMNIFMHPTPRGIPILETSEQVTTEINRSRAYLDGLLSGKH